MKKLTNNLSELIKACGNDFVSLVQYEPGLFRVNGNSSKYSKGTHWVDSCRTPEEAAKKFFLTL